MAYFRCGGGGVPASVKTDMNAVLNKKFGTSTDYPPADWAPTVNLMGPLPEKTQASASVCSFPDGADAVPLKKCEITLPASLDGYSSVNVVQSGKNILPNTAQTATENGVTFTVNSDGSVSLSGTCNADTNFYIYSGFTFPKLGQYFFSGCPSGGSTSTYRVFLTNYGADVGSGYLLNVSNLSTTTSIRINIKSGVVTDGLVFKPQIEAGSTATTYEAYETPTTHTANLGRTIHGGKSDVANGQGKNTHGKISDFSTLRANGTSSTGAYRYIIDVSGMGDYNVGYCVATEDLLTYRVSYNANVGEFYNTTNVLIIFLAQDNAQDAITYLQSNSCEIAYPLATPTDFTFDGQEIPTKLGYNAFWSNEGDTEVTYRADIDLLLGGN